MNYTKISLIFKSKVPLPYFIGSQLRGAFGYALKKVTCINPSFECSGCFASSNCLYYVFYEAKNQTHKYRFDIELAKEFYEFDFYLFDSACERLPYVVSAFYMMLTQIGLGKDKHRYEEFEMFINDENCFVDAEIKLPKNYLKKFQTPAFISDIKIDFVTPIRIKKNNRFVRDDSLELRDIVNSIYQRQMQLLGKEHRRFPYEIRGEIVKKDFYYKELTRQSNRQKTTMKLGGVMGEMVIKDIDENSLHVLKLGELIGVGKSSVFGLGKIKIINKGENSGNI